MTTFAKGLIADSWPLVLPDFRVEFHAARPKWEIGRLSSAFRRLIPGMRVIDVGAEHGDFTALYHSWGMRVLPVEPSVPYWPCIRQTFEANGFDPPPAWFVGFAADVSRFEESDHSSADWYERKDDGWPPCSQGEVVADFGFRHLAHDGETARITIDDLVDIPFPPFVPDALMIDVEGAEWHVLSGARQTLTTVSALVYVSVHEPTMQDWYGRTLNDLHALMDSYGYVGELLPANGEAETFWLYERRKS